MWEKLGFVVERSGDHVFATLRIKGKIIVRTKRSHGSGKLDGQIPMFIRQKMRLNERQFADAVQCPLSQAAYWEILREKGAFDD